MIDREQQRRLIGKYDSLFMFSEKVPQASQEIYQAWRLRILTSDELVSLSQSEMLVYFASWGLLASTAHNTVPQKFRINDSTLDLFLDRSFVLPVSDKDGKQATISLGCVVENICQAVQAYGLSTKLEFKSISLEDTKPIIEGAGDALAHTLTIKVDGQSQEVDTQRLKSILSRRVERGLYDEKVKIPQELREEIIDSVTDFNELEIHLITNRRLIQAFGIFQKQADTFVIGMQNFRQELSKYLLPNTDYREPRGMRGHEFNLDDGMSNEIHLGLKGERNLKLLNMIGFAKNSQEGINSSSALAVICSKKDTVISRIQAGMAYERIALMLQKRGFSTAVHAAITERSIPAIIGVSEIFKASILKTRSNPAVVFRIGVPVDKVREFPSSKPPIESLLI